MECSRTKTWTVASALAIASVVGLGCGTEEQTPDEESTSQATTGSTGEPGTDETSTTGTTGADTTTTTGDTESTGPIDEAPEDTLWADRVLNIAHAGGKGTRPEHTMIAYETAMLDGADVLELDVHATVDGVLVLMHDDTVDRTTDGTGFIAEMTFEELQALDAGYTFTTDDGATYPYRGMGLTVPTLEEVFEAYPDVAYVIEIKQGMPSIVEPFLDLCELHEIHDQMVASAFAQDILLELRAAAPQMPTSFALAEVVEFMGLDEESEATYEPPAEFLQVPLQQGGLNVLSAAFVERAERLDLKTHAWTINDEDEMQLVLDYGVNGVITDYPARLRDLLAE